MFKNIFNSFLKIKYFDLNLKSIKNKCLKIKKNNPNGDYFSNKGGWQSRKFNEEKPFEDLFNEINKCVFEIVDKIKIKKPIYLKNYWININYFGCFNKPHHHHGQDCVISGVYYINTPLNSGNIVFLQPNYLNYQEVTEYNEYNSDFWEIPCQENQCVLFPSYLEHYVEPNLNKKERISISFNYGF